MNQMLTGQVPRGWDAIDKAQLAGAPSGASSPRTSRRPRPQDHERHVRPGRGRGPSYELDLVLFTDFEVVFLSVGY